METGSLPPSVDSFGWFFSKMLGHRTGVSKPGGNQIAQS